MSLIAIIPTGQTEVTVNGLHQWDYGQTLEVHAAGLPAIIEIHFAHPGMKEAVVRTSSVTDEVAHAVIPDICLEQSSPVTAWVYAIEGTTGRTAATIHLPIIQRTRPATSAEIPTQVTDKYTELMTAVDDQMRIINQAGQNAETALGIKVDDSIAEIEETTAEAKELVNQLTTGEVEIARAKTVNGVGLAYAADRTLAIDEGVVPYLIPVWEGTYTAEPDPADLIPCEVDEPLVHGAEYEAHIEMSHLGQGTPLMPIKARGTAYAPQGGLPLLYLIFQSVLGQGFVRVYGEEEGTTALFFQAAKYNNTEYETRFLTLARIVK